ncbi:MAG: TonB-dependent receptor plug domain-containing protein [Myxococcota bacterium]|nr:TonB-dependent receptor plug domain-containing protein [Myxococcota bacterium]
MKSVLPLLVLASIATTAHAETGVWQGYRALGVPEAQLAALDFITVDGMRQGGLVDRVIADQRTADRCGVKVDCHCDSLRRRGLRFGAFGTIGHLGDLWTVELTLVDAHGCTVEASELLSESLADAEIASRLAVLARRLSTPQGRVVATATGTERDVDSTPAIVTSFTRQQLKALQIRRLDDLLPFVPGYDVVDANWGSTILNQGLQSTLLFLSNGIPLINAQTHFRSLDRDFRASLPQFDKIEIVRGPGSVLYGQNAFLGVINLISEIPTRREAVVDAGVSTSSLRTEEVWARAGENRGRYAFTAAVDAGRRIGPTTLVDDSPQATLGLSPPVFGNAGETKNAADTWFDTTVRVDLDNRLQLTFQNFTNDSNWELSPFGALLDEGQGGYWKKTHRIYAVAGQHPLYVEDLASVTLQARVSRYEFYSDENFVVQPLWPDGPEPAPGGRDLRLGIRSLQGNPDPRVANQLDVRVVHDLENVVTNRLMGGINILHQFTPASLATLIGIEQEPDPPFVSFTSRTFLSTSAFALDEFTPLPWLVLTGGARVQMDRIYKHDGGRRVPVSDHKFSATFQGGAAVTHGPLGGKIIYAEGIRAADGVQLFSRVGTLGDPGLDPEHSRSLATEGHFKPTRELSLRLGADFTRLSNVIVLEPLPPNPENFAYTPKNKGTTDLLGIFVGAQITTTLVDAFANYHFASIDESDPNGNPIPLARQTASGAVVVRPLPDLSIFVRGSLASGRTVRVNTADMLNKKVKTDPTIRTAIGASLADVIADADLEISVDNPFRLEHDTPYRLDGSVAGLIERRRGTEVFATLRYER